MDVDHSLVSSHQLSTTRPISDGDGVMESDAQASVGKKRAIEATFLILEQHYLELLEKGEVKSAMELLRGEISPLFNVPGTSRFEERKRQLKQRRRVGRLVEGGGGGSGGGVGGNSDGGGGHPKP
jgi:uncharacterized membrane protein YgcG